MANTKVNLDLLGRLVVEFNTQLAKVKESVDHQTTYTELSRCLGLATGLVMEATALAGDIQKELQINSVPAQPEGASPFEGLFGKFSRDNKN